MFLDLFALLSWLIISIFFIIKKNLSRAKNITLFFCFNIIIINTFTTLSLNMKVIQTSKVPELYFCILFQRNIIIPVVLLTYVNLSFNKSRLKSFVLGACTFAILITIETLFECFGIKKYANWSIGATALIEVAMILISKFMAKILVKLSPGGA